MKRLFLLLLTIMTLSSCGSYYYQVYDVASNIEEQNDQYMIENEDCAISFNFWKHLGNAAFTFYNKTDENLYIPLVSSSFIMNGYSNSLFENVDVTISISKMESRTYRSNATICVAPHASVVVYDKALLDRIYQFCDGKKDYPSKSYGENFTEDNTPISFRYHILYSFSMNSEQAKALEPAFYVSRIENFKAKRILETKTVMDCDSYQDTSYQALRGESPKRFYIEMQSSGITLY